MMYGQKSHKKQGFTLIEVMATLVVIIVGLGGMFITSLATSHAQSSVRDMIYAVNLAKLTLNDIRMEGLEWTTNPGQDLSQTKLKRLFPLNGVGKTAGVGTSWMLAFAAQKGHIFTVGPAGGDVTSNYAGNVATYDDGIAHEFPPTTMQRYCVWYRLTWVIPDYAIRADVRVAWPKEANFTAATGNSNNLTSYWNCPTSMVSDINNINFVTLSTTINRYSSVR